MFAYFLQPYFCCMASCNYIIAVDHLDIVLAIPTTINVKVRIPDCTIMAQFLKNEMFINLYNQLKI